MSKSAFLIAAALLAGAAHAQTTAFTYQGKLDSSGAPANGLYDFEFRVFDDATVGPPDTQFGPTLSFSGGSALSVNNGLVQVPLDFGLPPLADGSPRFLEIRVRPSGVGGFTTLSPRQALTSAPYSLTAKNLPMPFIESGPSANPSSAAFSIVNNGASGAGIQGFGPTFGTVGTGGAIVASYPGIPAPNGVTGLGVGTGVAGVTPGGYGVYGASTTGYGGVFDVLPTSIDTATALWAKVRGPNGGNAGLFEMQNTLNTNPAVQVNTASVQSAAYALRASVTSSSSGPGSAAVRAENLGTGPSVLGVIATVGGTGTALEGISLGGTGVFGNGGGSTGTGVEAWGWGTGEAVFAWGRGGGTGVRATADTGVPGTFEITNAANGNDVLTARSVSGLSNLSAVHGLVDTTSPGGFATGVRGENVGTGGNGIGVWGSQAGSGYGVYGTVVGGIGVLGVASGSSGTNYGVYGQTSSAAGYGGYFVGRVNVTGNLSVGGTLTKGGGSFKIDHPLDPENKYLSHSFVESPDMKNVYDGVATTDERGYATIQLPDWFGALNRDFRYQLTVVDGADSDSWAQAKVVKEISDHAFTLRTSQPNVKVSWQVTGIRKDAWAEKNRIPVEEIKSESEKGKYLHPEAYGLPRERGVDAASPAPSGGGAQ